ncbi:MAG: acyl-CoA thioesterase domain-containing protein [Solidesulfovibrio sp.]|uniref:PaaI family thioesterase n=1 Tax=Solidesulfovibrio sp. TaxID=2910990 RepID=UPI002B2112B1|nr:acyl-CoA thioesterase domain-containing protein [Solidesulfovibrio sp.]MEA4856292.1 hotdog domain-containing protein [Solidesulfovibrio sp.]
MPQPATHTRIDQSLCGAPVALSPGRAVVRLTLAPAMAVDDRGLVHGGFVFGLADHAAMLAVNDPLVVLGAAEVRFTAPTAVGETLEAEASQDEDAGKKRRVSVTVRRDGQTVFTGSFTCFVLQSHVLDL